MAGRPPKKTRPRFGQRLTTFRTDRGLTQTELGERLGISQKMVEYYERRAVNPSLALVEQAAKALDISVSELLGKEETKAPRRKPGPSSQLEIKIERIKQLPRKEQEFVLHFLDKVLEGTNQT